MTTIRTLTEDLAAHVGGPVHLAGWLHHQRRLGTVTFLLLRDRAGIAQVVVHDATERAALAALPSESVLRVTGQAVASEQAPAGVEVHDPVIEVVTAATAVPPFELRRSAIPAHLSTVLDHAAVALRHPTKQAAARVTAASVGGFRSTLDGLGFTEIYTPKIVAGATESGANVFSLDWFGRQADLAQSPQLYKQTMVGALERVYEVGPVFRAEPSDTTRHLAEYVSLDAELGFINDHRDVMNVLTRVLAGMIGTVAETAAAAVSLLGLTLPAVPDEIPAIGFVEAQEMIEAATGEAVVGEPDLAPAHERWLGDWAVREHGSAFVFVVGYPMAKRPFYTHPNPTDPQISNSFDLLFGGVELVTGGQRLHLYDDYLQALKGQDTAPLDGYLEAFRHGMPPHGGFAIGLERWVARIIGAQNIREVTLFPRDLHRLTP